MLDLREARKAYALICRTHSDLLGLADICPSPEIIHTLGEVIRLKRQLEVTLEFAIECSEFEKRVREAFLSRERGKLPWCNKSDEQIKRSVGEYVRWAKSVYGGNWIKH